MVYNIYRKREKVRFPKMPRMNRTNRKVNTNIKWEVVGYICLALAVFGQITVGKFYLVAQFAYLCANVATVIRDFVIDMPISNKTKDIVFTGITIALIVCRIFS
jgi:hypothetical protein